MKIESIPINELKFDDRNARLHPAKNLDSIKGSLKKFGQQVPIVVDKKNKVLKGNGTLAAAKALGFKNVWVVRSSLNEIQKKAFAIADNRSGELAKWDNDVLAKTLLDLRADDFEIEEIGFDDLDMKKILGDDAKANEESVEEPKSEWLVVIECDDETQQAEVYEHLQAEGLKCKIM